MRQIFLNLKAEGTTILLASHNMEDIRCLCDKVYEMDAGVLTPIDEFLNMNLVRRRNHCTEGLSQHDA